MPDAFTMDVAFRTGRLDGGARGQGHYLTAERKDGYVRDLGGDVFFAEMEGGNFRLAFNVLKPGPWQDPMVRRAIALWIDKPPAIASALGGFGWTSPDLGPPNIPIPRHFINWPKFDIGPLEEKQAEAQAPDGPGRVRRRLRYGPPVPRPEHCDVRVPQGAARRPGHRPATCS